MTRVTCVVVTRDRRELLGECLAAVTGQTRSIDHLIVVDNLSSDGSPELVRREFPEARRIVLSRNLGSAGGFAHGVVAALGTNADWLWLLDDDTIPSPDALERLLAAPYQQAGLPAPEILASRVNWTSGQPHPMNTPILRRRDPERSIRAAGVGLLPLRATTFVSLLVDASAVRRHGPPRAEFFLQADDIEFTARILRRGFGYLVPDSVVEHRTATPHTFLTDPLRFRFHLRNTVFMLRGTAWEPAEKAALVWVLIDSSARFLRQQRFELQALRLIAGALRDGVAPSYAD